MENFKEDEFINFINDFFDKISYAKPDPLDYGMSFNFHGLDMLDQVELIMEIEKHYYILIPDTICEEFDSISEIKNYLIRVTN